LVGIFTTPLRKIWFQIRSKGTKFCSSECSLHIFPVLRRSARRVVRAMYAADEEAEMFAEETYKFKQNYTLFSRSLARCAAIRTVVPNRYSRDLVDMPRHPAESAGKSR
jgi:hypothetical protein